MELNYRHATLAALGGGILSLLLSLLSGNALFALVAGLFLASSLVVFRFGSLLLPFLMKRLNIVETRGCHYLKDDAVVLAAEGRFLASCFLKVDVTESPSASSEDRQRAYAKAFEKMISSLRFPVKYSVLVYNLDTEKYREDVLVKRLEAEMALGRLKKQPKPDVFSVAREERKLVMYSRLLERLASGEKPMDAEYYVMTTAQGVYEQQAIKQAKRQSAELKAVIANSLNAPVTEVSGESLRNCIDWEYVLPPSYEEFSDSF
ncbi:hypothetical protein HZC09_02365 [Candidatus Micrarchaeota archaeon]|nr:hypothetical protein [Candidatus Micrarchaeota archaeon]